MRPGSGWDWRRRMRSRPARRQTARTGRRATTSRRPRPRPGLVPVPASSAARRPGPTGRCRACPAGSGGRLAPARAKRRYPVCCHWMSRWETRPGTMTRSGARCLIPGRRSSPRSTARSASPADVWPWRHDSTPGSRPCRTSAAWAGVPAMSRTASAGNRAGCPGWPLTRVPPRSRPGGAGRRFPLLVRAVRRGDRYSLIRQGSAHDAGPRADRGPRRRSPLRWRRTS